MRRIIADSPTMQELYDLYNKPLNVSHTTMNWIYEEDLSKRDGDCPLVEIKEQTDGRDNN